MKEIEITFSLFELEPLLMEINGASNNEKVIFKGLLNENIPLSDKYHLNSLSNTVKSHFDTYWESIKKYLKDNNINEGELIPEKNQKDILDLQNQEIKINFKQLNIENLNKCQSDFNYSLIWKKGIYTYFEKEKESQNI